MLKDLETLTYRVFVEPGETLFFEEVLQRLREIDAIKLCVSIGKIVNSAALN